MGAFLCLMTCVLFSWGVCEVLKICFSFFCVFFHGALFVFVLFVLVFFVFFHFCCLVAVFHKEDKILVLGWGRGV